MLMQTATLMANAAVAANEPNWMLVGIIFGAMALIAIVLLLIPTGNVKALEDADKKDRSALKAGGERKSLEDLTDKDKEKMSLAEIKEAKRATVSEDKSKEEMRRLRQERRAATQTEKAIQERESSKPAESASEKAEVTSEVKKEVEVKAEESVVAEVKADNEVKADEAVSSATESADLGLFASSEKAKEESQSDPDDLFASLFGDDQSGMDFGEEFGGNSASADDGTLFPTLGSALIPLNEFTKAAEEGGNSDTLDELTKRLSDSAEKKTLA